MTHAALIVRFLVEGVGGVSSTLQCRVYPSFRLRNHELDTISVMRDSGCQSYVPVVIRRPPSLIQTLLKLTLNQPQSRAASILVPCGFFSWYPNGKALQLQAYRESEEAKLKEKSEEGIIINVIRHFHIPGLPIQAPTDDSLGSWLKSGFSRPILIIAQSRLISSGRVWLGCCGATDYSVLLSDLNIRGVISKQRIPPYGELRTYGLINLPKDEYLDTSLIELHGGYLNVACQLGCSWATSSRS